MTLHHLPYLRLLFLLLRLPLQSPFRLSPRPPSCPPYQNPCHCLIQSPHLTPLLTHLSPHPRLFQSPLQSLHHSFRHPPLLAHPLALSQSHLPTPLQALLPVPSQVLLLQVP